MCLIARYLEANGIPTLCLGSAFDILSAGAPPRAMFVNYPLGHSAGKPFDRADQEYVVESALNGFNSLKKSSQIGMIDSDWGSTGWKNEANSPLERIRDSRVIPVLSTSLKKTGSRPK